MTSCFASHSNFQLLLTRGAVEFSSSLDQRLITAASWQEAQAGLEEAWSGGRETITSMAYSSGCRQFLLVITEWAGRVGQAADWEGGPPPGHAPSLLLALPDSQQLLRLSTQTDMVLSWKLCQDFIVENDRTRKKFPFPLQ